MRRTFIAALVTAALALAFAGVAAAANGGFTPVTPHSPNASRINDAYLWIAIFTGAIFGIVEGALLFFTLRFRRGKRSREAEGPQIRGHARLEIVWTVIPVVILVAIGGFVFYKLPGITDVPRAT
ncbi:MAG: cytochrome c oxidase subunit II transmembrane domain-containing protein, partial [Gaiellaceae bacterium]